MENDKDFTEVLHVPYVNGFSEGLLRKFRKLQIGLVPEKQETIYSNRFKLVRDIGETGQHFCQQANQHQSDIENKKTTNRFYAHL